jgi:hypothetical protein
MKTSTLPPIIPFAHNETTPMLSVESNSFDINSYEFPTTNIKSQDLNITPTPQYIIQPKITYTPMEAGVDNLATNNIEERTPSKTPTSPNPLPTSNAGTIPSMSKKPSPSYASRTTANSNSNVIAKLPENRINYF